MSVNFDLKINVLTVAAVIVAVFMFFSVLSSKDDAEVWENNYNVLNTEHMEFISKHDSAIIYKDNIIELTRNELKNAVKSDSIQRELVKKYKKEAAVVKIEWRFHPKDTVFVDVPISIDNDTTAHIVHECYEIDLSVKNGGISLANLVVDNRQDMVLGARKKSLWATEQAFDIRNTNPCIKTLNVTTYKVTIKEKWHEKWFITIPVGFGTGYLFGRANR